MMINLLSIEKSNLELACRDFEPCIYGGSSSTAPLAHLQAAISRLQSLLVIGNIINQYPIDKHLLQSIIVILFNMIDAKYVDKTELKKIMSELKPNLD